MGSPVLVVEKDTVELEELVGLESNEVVDEDVVEADELVALEQGEALVEVMADRVVVGMSGKEGGYINVQRPRGRRTKGSDAAPRCLPYLLPADGNINSYRQPRYNQP